MLIQNTYLKILKTKNMKIFNLKNFAYALLMIFVGALALLNVNATRSETRLNDSNISIADLSLSTQTLAACDGDDYRDEKSAVCHKNIYVGTFPVVMIINGHEVIVMVPTYRDAMGTQTDCEPAILRQCYPQACDAS